MPPQQNRICLADKNSPLVLASIIATATPSINGLVVVNPDGTTVWGSPTASKTTLEKIQTASDYKQTFTFLDAWTADERIGTIVHSSASLALSLTETYVWAWSTPNFYLSTITIS